jgi:hypothetical protein
MKTEREQFDYGDLYWYSTIFIRIGSVGIVSVLDDAGCVWPKVSEYLSRISGPLGPLSSIQLREIAARLAYVNSRLNRRPDFFSELAYEQDLTIRLRLPRPEKIEAGDRLEQGRLLDYLCSPHLPLTPNFEERIRQLQRDEVQFLYHDDGSFIEN